MKLDSEAQELDEQLAIARALPAKDLPDAVIGYNWDNYPEQVLGVIAGRPDCSLMTALGVFYSAEPWNFVRPDASERYQLLKRIFDRVNAGGYRHNPTDHRKEWSFGSAELLQDATAKENPYHWQWDQQAIALAAKVPDEILSERRTSIEAHYDSKAREIVAGLNGNEAVRKMTGLLLKLMPDEIKTRVDELMAEAERERQRAKAPLLSRVLSGLFKPKR